MKVFSILIVLCITVSSMWSYPWPIRDFQGPHQINATLGDYRQGITGNPLYPRFHNGVDIQASESTKVYSIVSDTVRHYGATGVIVGGYTYIHLTARYPHGELIEGIIDSTAPLDSIGVTNTENHVHFSEGIYPDGPFQNPLANGGLDNYTDNNSPTIIATPQFFPQGEELTSNRNPLHTDTLYGKVDIRVHMRDFANTGQGSGIYTCSYAIADTLDSIYYNSGTTIIFDQVGPPSNGTPVVYVYDTTVTEHANSATFHYWATNPIVSNQVEDRYWNTKQQEGEPDSVDADSIEVAKFKDGYYWVKIYAYDISDRADSESVYVHVDNFNPKVKITYPTNYYHYIEKYEKEVWCTFSEAMDAATLIPANITIRSLVDTSHYYSIVNITYIDSLFKLVLEVDSFFFHDEVEVQLSDSITDLAGKSVEQGGGGEKGVAYSWKFTVGVIKLTDNDIDDIRPDIYGDKIAWVEVLSLDPLTSNTKLHDLTSHNTVTLNTTTGFHNWPIVWKDQVAWRQEFGSEPLCRDRIYYYDGNSTQLIISEDLCRNQFDFDSSGIVMYSSVYSDTSLPDTVWVQYYEIGSGLLLLDEYTVRDDLSRDVNIDGDQIVWEHAEDASGSDGGEIIGSSEGIVLRYERGLRSGRETKRVRIPMDTNGGSRRTYVKDIYLRSYSGVSNLTGFMDTTINGMPSLSHGQSAWVSWIFGGSTLPFSVWMNDGARSRQLSGSLSSSYRIYWPTIENGDVVWHDWDLNTGQQRLHYYDGRQDNILAYEYSPYFAFWGWHVENEQAVWLQLAPSYGYSPTYYDGEQIVTLVDRDSTSYRIGISDGLVVYDAWDGHDNEIYLYVGDTLFTPPALARNVRNEILETDDKEKQDAGRMAEAASKNPRKTKSVDEADTQTREDTQVRVIWSPNSEPDLAGYNVYRSETAYTYGTIPYGTVLANDTIFLDTIPMVSTNYYVVTAFDGLNNESGFSNQTLADLTPDTIPPPPPENLAAVCDSPYQQVSLAWSPVSEPEVSYRVYRADSSGGYTAPLAAVEDTAFADTTVVQGYTYYYVVTAVDTLSNESGYSNEDTIQVPDITPPSPPTNLAAACDSPYQAVDLTWNATTAPDVGLYRIYRADSSGGYSTPLDSVADSVTAYADSTILQGMTYYYVVTAVDTCNNESGYSDEDTILVPDITPPLAPTNLVAAYDSLNHWVSLIWDLGTEPDLWIYRVYRSDTSGNYTTPYDSVFAPDTVLIDSMISSGMTYYYVVSAVDTNNNESGFSNEDSVTIPDTLPPSPPANLVAVCDSPYQAVDLTWDSVPEPDVGMYRIYRSDTSGVYATPMDSVSASVTAYADSAITQGMRYYYVVTAVDTSRNESEYSNEDSVLVPDITPPAAPDNLVALYDSIYRAVELNWNAPPEPDLALYRIYRSGTSGHYTTPLDSVLEPITTYIDLAISFDTTYYYVVTAVDTCDNKSEYSNEAVVVIPDTTPPSAPTSLAATYDSMSQSISLSWTAPSDPDIELYRLYRSEISGYYGIPLDSVPAGTTTAVDSTMMLGKTYYYVVTAVDSSNNESGYSDEDMINVPVRFMSFSPLASAYNNGRRMVRNPSTEELFLSYAKSDSTALCAVTADGGMTWLRSAFVGPGNFPSMALDSDTNLHCVFRGFADTDLLEGTTPSFATAHFPKGLRSSYAVGHAVYDNGMWQNASLYETPDSILSVSFATDPLDTGWVVFNTYVAGTNTLKIGKFYTAAFPCTLQNITTLDTYSSLGIASMIVKPNDRSIWVIYERNGTIVVRWRRSNGNWYSHTLQQEGIYPTLSLNQAGDLVHFIWEKYYSETDTREIQWSYTDGRRWAIPRKIAQVAYENCYPIIEKGVIAVWTDYHEVYASNLIESGSWSTPENISNTTSDSRYPQAALWQSISQTKLAYCWTEGNQAPYETRVKMDSLVYDGLPLYVFDLGDDEPSLVSTRRQGAVKYGDGYEKTVDYDAECLDYELRGLDQDKIYKLKLVFYQNETDQPWEQAVAIDGRAVRQLSLCRDGVVTAEIVLSRADYGDGRINVRINRLTGNKVVLSALSLWEYEREGVIAASAGPQSSGTEEIGSVLLGVIYPNPGKADVKIRLTAPRKMNISIKLYDVAGRMVEEVFAGRITGFHEIPVTSKTAPSGVYFMRIVADGKTTTEKVLLLK